MHESHDTATLMAPWAALTSGCTYQAPNKLLNKKENDGRGHRACAQIAGIARTMPEFAFCNLRRIPPNQDTASKELNNLYIRP